MISAGRQCPATAVTREVAAQSDRLLTCKLHQSITGWHVGPVKSAVDLDILVINWGHSL